MAHSHAALALLLCAGCGSANAAGAHVEVPAAAERDEHTRASARDFLLGLLRPWPSATGPLALALTHPRSERVSSYDNALIALYLIRHGQREMAGRILAALAELQQPDGALPFSFPWPLPNADELYVRSGAAAWVGYAATEYLDAERGGPAREAITALAHRVANYLMAHQLHREGDPRDGLVSGGTGSYRLQLEGGAVRERFFPGDIPWASSEHNIDSWFFLRDFAALTGDERPQRSAAEIRGALLSRGIDAASGQLVRGFNDEGLDRWLALDCASWAALFLHAAGEDLRAETALGSAEVRYRSREPASGARGHKPYAHAPLIENRALADHLRLPAKNWDDLEGVWPEGSAGVALAALRLGHRERAREILAELEKLRHPGGGLPTFSVEIPSEFDTQPSLAGTAWVELVRSELERPATAATLWRKR
jgi:hypothetical protein